VTDGWGGFESGEKLVSIARKRCHRPIDISEATNMDVNKILAELRHEREQIEDAIISLERLARGRGKRRGRPPAWMKEAQERRRGRPPGSKNRAKSEDE
jgi:hypothetical protein